MNGKEGCGKNSRTHFRGRRLVALGCVLSSFFGLSGHQMSEAASSPEIRHYIAVMPYRENNKFPDEKLETVKKNLTLLSRFWAESSGGTIQISIAGILEVEVPEGESLGKTAKKAAEKYAADQKITSFKKILYVGSGPLYSAGSVVILDYSNAPELMHEVGHSLGYKHLSNSLFGARKYGLYSWDAKRQKYVVSDPLIDRVYLPLGMQFGFPYNGFAPRVTTTIMANGTRTDQPCTYDKYLQGALPEKTEFACNVTNAADWVDGSTTVRLYAHDELTAVKVGGKSGVPQFSVTPHNARKTYAVTFPHTYLYFNDKRWESDPITKKIFIEYVTQPTGRKYGSLAAETTESPCIRVYMNRMVLDPEFNDTKNVTKVSPSYPFAFSDDPGPLISQDKIGNYVSHSPPWLGSSYNDRFIPPPIRYPHQIMGNYFSVDVLSKGIQASTGHHYVDLKVSIHKTPKIKALAGDLNRNGVDDVWEHRFFPTEKKVKFENDTDNDGYSNMDEYTAGTDPLDATDYLKMVYSDNALRWNVREGRRYNIVPKKLTNNKIQNPLASGLEEGVYYPDITKSKAFYRLEAYIPVTVEVE